jgi:hypothetical protein
MHDSGKLSDEVYNFVLDFLALAIMAQDPRQFQVDADPLAF